MFTSSSLAFTRSIFTRRGKQLVGLCPMHNDHRSLYSALNQMLDYLLSKYGEAQLHGRLTPVRSGQVRQVRQVRVELDEGAGLGYEILGGQAPTEYGPAGLASR